MHDLWKIFIRVFDLAKTFHPLFGLREESGRVYVRSWKEFGFMSYLLLLYFLLGFFFLPTPAVTRREINSTPYNPSQDGFLVRSG